jgi:hypothetical protein
VQAVSEIAAPSVPSYVAEIPSQAVGNHAVILSQQVELSMLPTDNMQDGNIGREAKMHNVDTISVPQLIERDNITLCASQESQTINEEKKKDTQLKDIPFVGFELQTANGPIPSELTSHHRKEEKEDFVNEDIDRNASKMMHSAEESLVIQQHKETTMGNKEVSDLLSHSKSTVTTEGESHTLSNEPLNEESHLIGTNLHQEAQLPSEQKGQMGRVYEPVVVLPPMVTRPYVFLTGDGRRGNIIYKGTDGRLYLVASVGTEWRYKLLHPHAPSAVGEPHIVEIPYHGTFFCYVFISL